MKIVIKELLLVGLLAAFGGFINTLACKPKEEPYNWKRAFPEVAIAIFAGLLVHWLLKNFDISDNYRIVGVALAGYSARGVLNVFNRLFLDHIKGLKFLWLFGAAACLFALTGCKASNVNVSQKAVTLKGYSAINLIDTSYNPVTGTFTPKITSIVSSGMYNSVPLGTSFKDYLFYSNESSCSVFNASAKTTTEVLIFSTSEKTLMKKIVDTLAKNLEAEAKAEAEEE